MTRPNPINPVSFATTAIRGGLAIATIPALGVARELTMMSVSFSVNVRFDVYVGGIAPSNRVAGNPNGAQNDGSFTHPIHVPGGNQVFVVWQSATGSGSVRAQFRPVGML